MKQESLSQEFTLKNINETGNYFLEEIEQNKWMSRNHKKVYSVLNYNQHLLILASTFSAFVSLIGIHIGTASSAIGLKVCVITGAIKKYDRLIKKKKKRT